MSAPNGNGKPDAPEKIPCRDCKALLGKGQYKKVADGVVCKDGSSCRARQLAVTLGIDLFTQYPRERLLYEMDIRPADYKKSGWKPIFTEDERVMAGWLYYSWCFPICMPYAVQIDADDEIVTDRYRKPMVMDQVRLGQIIGMSKQAISRSTIRLAARKKLRTDDGQVYPEPKPKITPDERLVISTDDLAYIGEDPNTIPLKYRRLLNDLLGQAPEVIRTDYRARAFTFCTDYNEAHAVIRTTRDRGIEQVCTEIASLLSRPLDFKTKRAGVVSTPAPLGPPAQNQPVDEDRQTPHKQEHTPPDTSAAQVLYAGIPELQKCYPKAPFAKPRFNALGKADRQLSLRILDALEGEGWKGGHRSIAADDVTAFLAYVDALLANGRSPKKLGLLLEWAGDWAREAPQRARDAADYRAMQAMNRQREQQLRAEQEREDELERVLEESWEQMPAAERGKRIAAALPEVQTLLRDRWKLLTKKQQTEQLELYAKRVLRREISDAPGQARGAAND